VTVAVPFIAVIGIVISLLGFAASMSPAGRAKQAERYCTKHAIRRPFIPGGPERLVWVYGPHRTQGNACDGPEHRRVTAYW
jgi:hypothetical protein